MKINVVDTVKTLDRDFIYYVCKIDEDDDCEHPKEYTITFDELCYCLATCIFDDGYSLKRLDDVKKIFGPKVFKKVYRNLMTRNHDT